MGFHLTDPYVEQCWSAVIGPSSTPCASARVPAQIGASDLSRSLGLGAGAGEHGRLVNTLQGLVRFALADPAADAAGLDVYRQVAPLGPHLLARVPEWTRATHKRLFGARLEQIDDVARHQTSVASITARLDCLQHGPGRAANAPTPHGQALGR